MTEHTGSPPILFVNGDTLLSGQEQSHKPIRSDMIHVFGVYGWSDYLPYTLTMCSHYPTPSLVHLSKGDYDRVYEPSEDSFLFLDALEKDIDCLKELKYDDHTVY